MLVVKQVEAANENELAYECYNGEQKIGRLVASWQPDGNLEAHIVETGQREAARTLVAKLERDIIANGLRELYLVVRTAKERDEFLPAGYDPVDDDNDLRLFKALY